MRTVGMGVKENKEVQTEKLLTKITEQKKELPTKNYKHKESKFPMDEK